MADMVKMKDTLKADKVSKKSSKRDKPKKSEKTEKAATKAFSLLADEGAVDQSLSSLFTAKPLEQDAAPVVARPSRTVPELGAGIEIDVKAPKKRKVPAASPETLEADAATPEDLPERKRKRKRRDADEDLEGAYLDKLAREEERDAAKRRKRSPTPEGTDAVEPAEQPVSESDDIIEDDDDDIASPPPMHETQQAASDELSKANRTVFLGNVSTTAISSKTARKTLTKHLESFFTDLKTTDKHPKIESIRFRSTPYATAVPKKAAYARKEVMDETSKSTNAYIVYSSPQLAREAAKRLNGTMVLDRHLRVDEIAHPAQIDHRRCVFVGNLGFVDDESNIQQANEDEGREVRKRGKEPGDVEEGLWRTFSRCGTVESVRVIRDSTTRVGKGIAYVQFDDANAVEAALLYNEKKFPPMLPRKLRVSRAKAMKRNAQPGSGRPSSKPTANASTGYQRKISGEEASRAGRVGKLYGRAAAAKMKQPARPERRERPQRTERPSGERLGEGIRKPEEFVFEGHRASSKSGKSGLKLGGKKKGGGKPTGRSAKRGAVFKAGQRKGK